MGEQGIARRKHVRLSAMGPVEALVQGGEPLEAFLASISRGGLGLYLAGEVRPNQLVLVSLRLMARGGGGEDLKVGTRVRWVRQAHRLFMAGLSFEKMSDARYARLLEHLNLIEELQAADPRASRSARFSVRE